MVKEQFLIYRIIHLMDFDGYSTIGEYSLKRYKYILFDLDGTLLDTKPGVLGSVKKTFDELSLPLPNDERLEKFMGPPLDQCFMDVCGLDAETTVIATKVFRRFYEGGGLFNARPYDGIPELLSALKSNGRRLFVATSKYELFAERVIRHFELDGFFDKIAGAPKDIEKPWLKKDSIKRALEGFSDANSSNTVIIGDRKFDAEGAKEAGIDSIGVLFGYGKSDELEASSFNMIVPDVKTLTDVLLKDK